ncbi:extracellular solute-binding protein [Candidatus Gottesmanbacteria bacterium]|nr:extracellular solute-binding protein [Candidatus Gottesmanbacteria bacterium]
MDNLPKDPNPNPPAGGSNPEPTTPEGGELYQNPDQYSAQLTPETYPPEPTQTQDFSGVPPPSSPGEFGSVPPPPYEEDRKGKIILIIGIILVVLVVIFLIIKFLGGRGASQSSGGELTYWGLWEDANTIKPLIDDYQKSHPNVKITYTKQNPKQYRERLQAALTRGEGPDIFRFHNTWTSMFASDLSPMPDTIYTTTEFEKTFYPVAKADLNINNKYYGIPLEIDGLVLLYNDDILKAQNITVPTDWENFQQAAITLTTPDSTTGKILNAGVALGSADNIDHFSDILGLMFLQNGTNLQDPLGPCTDPTSTTCAVDTLIFYRKFAELPNNTWDDTQDNSIVAFAGGKVAMIFAPTWQIFTIKQINPNLNLKVATVPQLPGITINWATYWVEGVSKRSKSPEAAWEFLKFLSSKESLTKLYTEQAKTRIFGEPYSRIDLASTLESNQYLAPLIKQAPTMKSFPFASSTQDNGINDQMIKYLLDAVNSLKQGASPQSALETASSGFKQVLTKYTINAAPSTAPIE